MAELPRMTGAQARRAVRLLRRLCANCDGGYCLPLGGEPCPQTLTRSLICKYFRAAVLPADTELCAELLGRGVARRCRVCGTAINPAANAAKYCPRCAVEERRRKTRDRMRRLRAGR